MDPKEIPVGIDPELAFRISVRVGAYIAVLNDGSTTAMPRTDLEWIINVKGYTIDKLYADLGERIIWGPSQEASAYGVDKITNEHVKFLYTHELQEALMDRWNLKYLFLFVEVVPKAGYQCSQSSVTCLDEVFSGNDRIAARIDISADGPCASNAPHSPTPIAVSQPVGTTSNNPCNAWASEGTVDWTTIEITQGAPSADDDRDVAMGEDDMYVLLGLRADDDTRVNSRRTTPMASPLPCGIEEEFAEAAIAVDDDIPGESGNVFDQDNPTMSVGDVFPDMKAFRLAVRKYAINEQFDIHTIKSDKTRFRGRCKDVCCPWTINAHSTRKGETIRVTKKPFEHTCSSTSRVKTSMASQGWVADRVMGTLRKHPHLGAKEIQERLQDEYKVTLQYETVWAGRQKAMDRTFGSWEDSFEELYRFKAEIDLRSPGSIIEIANRQIGDKTYFHRFFMALKPCIDGFLRGCRPYLSVDSTALNGKWNGQLAAVTALDGHNWMFPVAFGFIESETTDNWTWFMQQLKKAIGNPPTLAICSDACKGLENAVQNVFPAAEQRECFRHLMQNFVKKFHGPIFGNMYPAARAYRADRFDHYMGRMLEASPEVGVYLKKHHNLLWMRSRFSKDIKCDYINNNLAESFNSWIKGLKDLPVVELVDKLREKIMEMFYKRRRIGERLQGEILPAIIHQLNMKTRNLDHLKVGTSSHESAEVTEVDNNHEVHRHVVYILAHECTCGEWQLTGKPCPHAMAFITTVRNANMEGYVHNYYSVAKFRAAYEGVVQPITGKNQWPKVDLGFKLFPPLGKRSAGRPRKSRFPSFLEKGKSSRARRQCKCSRCGEFGHRADGCSLNANKKRKRTVVNNRKRKATKKGIAKGASACTPPIALQPAEGASVCTPPVTLQPTEDASVCTPPVALQPATLSNSPGPVTRRQLALTMGGGDSQDTTPRKKFATPRKKVTTSPRKKLTPIKKKK